MRSGCFPTGGRARSRPGLRLRYFRVGGFLATRGLLARLVRDGVELHPPLLRHAPRRGESGQPVHRGAHHVVGVGRAQAFGEDVAHPGAFEHRAHRAPGDHAGPRRRGLEEHTTRSVVADDLVRDRAAGERHLHHLAARGLHRPPPPPAPPPPSPPPRTPHPPLPGPGRPRRAARGARAAAAHPRGGAPPPPLRWPRPPPPPPATLRGKRRPTRLPPFLLG